LFCTLVHAHPLDDEAELQANLRVVDDRALELELEFRYRNVVASYTEFRNGLDRNQDGIVTRDEVKRRFVELADEVGMGLGVSLNGERVSLDPDFSRFEFKDLDNPDADLDAGIDTSIARIYCKLVYEWRAPKPFQPGTHTLEFFFNSAQTVVHTPHEQLFAFGTDGSPLAAEYDLAHFAFPRLRASFEGRRLLQVEVTIPAGRTPRSLGTLPGWVTLIAGSMLAALGAVTLITHKPGNKGRALTGLLLLIAGGAAILGALAQLGVLGLP
jgi:hypothetical protein